MKIPPIFTSLLVLGALLRPQSASACDACSCSASNLSQWTTFGTARSLLEVNTQWLHWEVDGYALADSISDQRLQLYTVNGIYNLNARWSLLGGGSVNRTSWHYPASSTALNGVGNFNLGARYTHFLPVAGRNLYLGGSALVHLPNGTEAADPLNLAQTPLGLSGNAFVRYQRGMHHHLLVWAGRYS